MCTCENVHFFLTFGIGYRTTGDTVPLTFPFHFFPHCPSSTIAIVIVGIFSNGQSINSKNWNVFASGSLFFSSNSILARAWDLCVIKCFTHAPLDYDAWEFIGQPKSRIHSFSRSHYKNNNDNKKKTIFSAKQIKSSLSLELALCGPAWFYEHVRFFHLFVRFFFFVE